MRTMAMMALTAGMLAFPGLAQEPDIRAYVDTHVHLRSRAEGMPGALTVAIKAMDEAGIATAILLPQPFPATALPNKHDHAELIAVIRRHPGRFAVVGGGGSLNGMILGTPAEQAGAEVRAEFRRTAEQLVAAGVRGFGEISVLHLSHFPGHPFEETQADHPLLLLLADIAAGHGLPIDIHMDVVERRTAVSGRLSSISNAPALHANVEAFERLLDHNPEARIVLAHAGWDPVGQWTVELSRRLLSRHPNLFMSLKLGSQGGMSENAPLESERLRPEWRALLTDFADRFVIGSDSFFAPEKAGYAQAWTDFSPRASRILLEQLPADVAAKIGSANARRLYGLDASPRPAPAAAEGAGQRFAAWDADGDGRLSRAEWKGPPPRFQKLDADGDGFVSLSEFDAAPAPSPPQPAASRAGPPTGQGPGDPAACDKCQQEWTNCMVGKAGITKQRCDEAMFRCQRRC